MPPIDHVALKYFCLPPRETLLDVLKGINAAGGDTDVLAICSSFAQNLDSLMRTASLPFVMAATSVSLRYEIAERIRDGAEADEQNDPSVSTRVAARLKARFESKEEMVAVGRKILDELEHSRLDDSFRTACAELLLQAVVLTWSTFEVLVSDVFVLLLNQNPKFATELMKDDRTKKWFQPRELVTMLPDYGYDLSTRMGDVLIVWHRLDDVQAIRTVLEVLFAKHSDLHKALHDKSLWLLNQRRNLIVHRRAVIDRAYVEGTGDNTALGTRLIIEPQYLESTVELVRDVGAEILKAAMLK